MLKRIWILCITMLVFAATATWTLDDGSIPAPTPTVQFHAFEATKIQSESTEDDVDLISELDQFRDRKRSSEAISEN